MNLVDIKIIDKKEGVTEIVSAEQIDEQTFKLQSNPVMLCKINYGTTVRAEKDENGEYIMTKILKPSDFQTRKFFLSSSLTQSELKEYIGDKIVAAGGEWEVVFGGIAFIHIPRQSSFDLDKIFKDLNYSPSEILDEE